MWICVRRCVANSTSSVVGESFARDDATTPEPTALLSTFVPLRSTDKSSVFGAVQIDNDYALMMDATEQPWKQVQIAFAILALICLVMAIVSLVWSHRPVAAETDGFGPSRREVRAAAKDEKKASAAEADAAKLRERVKELEGKTKAHSEQQAELEKLRDRVAEFESRPALTQVAAEADPAEIAQLKAHASQLEEQARGAESRVTQLQSRVTEMEAQLRVTTDQLRMAQQRAEEALAAPPAVEVPPEVEAELQGKLTAAAEVEQLLRDELEASREETQRARHELELMELAHSEEARSQQGQLDQVRAQARLAEEERQRILAEAAKSPTAQEVMSADAESRIKELTQLLERSEAERAMLRAGRPETVYEARNRQLEDEIASLRERLDGPGPHGAPPTNIDPVAFAALEARLVAAEERARDAERRLDDAAAKPRSRSRASRRAANAEGEANGNGTGNGKVDAEPGEATVEVEAEVEPQADADAGRRRSAGPDRGRQRAAEQVGPEHGRPAPGHLHADAHPDARANEAPLARQQVHGVRVAQTLIDLIQRQPHLRAHPVSTGHLSVLIAHGEQLSPDEPADARRRDPVRPPLPEAELTDQADALRVPVTRAVSKLVFDHPAPERDAPDHGRTACPPQQVEVVRSVEAARARELWRLVEGPEHPTVRFGGSSW